MMKFKQVILVRTDLGMGRGKIAVQCSHAAVGALEKALKEKPGWVEKWRESGMAKIVLRVESEKELLEWRKRLEKKFPIALIRDAGQTQIEKGTITALGIGPCPEKEIDLFTKELRLL